MKLAHIKPDANQPRRYFDQAELKKLKTSIQTNGIINPLTVEKIGKDDYLLIDGERRYRAAKELKLKDVPVTEIEPKDESERLLYQFNIQEHHQNWTTLEKAYAVEQLSRTLGVTMNHVCEMLGIDKKTATAYKSFVQLANPELFQKHDINIHMAQRVVQLTNFVKRIYDEELKEDFDLNEQKRFEKAVASRIANGQIVGRFDLTKLRMAFKVKPEFIEEFMSNTVVSPHDLYRKAGAETQRTYNNIITSTNWLASYVTALMKDMDEGREFHKVNTYDTTHLKYLKKKLDELINRID